MTEDILSAKPVSNTRSTLSVVALPRDSNHYGVVYGGTVMGLVDQAAYCAAIRHARCAVVTVCVEELSLLRAIHIGDVITVKASVNYVGNTSMIVGVRIETEKMVTGVIEHVGSAYITMVAIDENGKPTKIPKLQLENDDDKRRFEEARQRKMKQLSRSGKCEAVCGE